MPRFGDEWLIDKTLFDYVQGGSCACCSFNFLPSGTKGLIESLSELETDAAEQEVNALSALPWPPEMKDQVWMERVRLRHLCKQQMKSYREFWQTYGPGFKEWFHELTTSRLQRYLQLPRSELLEVLKSKDDNTDGNKSSSYQIHAAFGSVLCAVTEQVAHFELTQYPNDGRGQAELEFEKHLTFDRRGGFTLKDLDSTMTRNAWLLRHETLGGPKLLERNPLSRRTTVVATPLDGESSSDDEEEKEEEVPENNPRTGVPTPSFRSDRRILRLLIARHFADVLQRAYLKDTDQGEPIIE